MGRSADYYFLFCSNLNKKNKQKVGRFFKDRSGYGKQRFFFLPNLGS